MPLESHDLRRLKAAEGFLTLGMFEEATAELEEIDPFCRALPEVLRVRLGIYAGAKRWELMEVVAAKLAHHDPADPQWVISLAFATRRSRSIEAAKAILIEASERYEAEPIIHYNLGCYECQLGALSTAKGYLTRAFALQPECRLMALEDEDLRPLWDSLNTIP